MVIAAGWACGRPQKVLILPASDCRFGHDPNYCTAGDGLRNLQQTAAAPRWLRISSDHESCRYAANPNIYGHGVCLWAVRTARWIWWWKHPPATPTSRSAGHHSGVRGTSRPSTRSVRLQGNGGEASLLQKEKFPISELIWATECAVPTPPAALPQRTHRQHSDLLVQAGGNLQSL
jgi:hypothetical protein